MALVNHWLTSFIFLASLLVGCSKPAGPPPDALAIALAPVGNDHEITRWQAKARQAKDPVNALEQLGWLFVRAARTQNDPGFYKLAEACALAIESRHPHEPAALLLRGHVLDSLHQFKAAEALARELVAAREMAADWGLLGDALMEQGRLDAAVGAYQKMMDLRPDLHAYARAAHMRWLKGDLPGAIDVMELAAHAASPNDPESGAWVFARLALYRLQAGDMTLADRDCDVALQFQKDYPAALLVRGRILMAGNKFSEAVEVLQQAARLNPLPDYEWTLAEALRAAGRTGEAVPFEQELRQRGGTDDPRTLALFLATRGEDAAAAIRLARAELQTRQDIFTYDALAWALQAAGQHDEAQVTMRRALAEGTQDARLALHAFVILNAPINIRTELLLPSERNLLQPLLAKNQTKNRTEEEK